MSAPAIPLSRTAAETYAVEQEVRQGYDGIWHRGVFRYGPEAEALEVELAAFLGARHAVLVSSGGAAITIALRGLGVRPGDDVVTVPNVDISLAAPIAHAGARLVWCDVEASSLNLDADVLERAITPATRAVLVVHLFGHPADLDRVREVAAARGVPVVEDASHAPGATWRDRPCGTLGDVACLSLSAGKPLGAASSAGVLLTDDDELHGRLRLLANYGLDPSDLHAAHHGVPGARYHGLVEGWNASLDEWQAVVLRAKLRRLPEWVDRRRAQAEIYGSRLASLGSVRAQTSPPHARPAPRCYAVRVPERDRLVAALARRGIAAGVGYSPPLHQQPLYRSRAGGASACPTTDRVAAELVTLPIHPYLLDDEVHRVADAVAELVPGLCGTRAAEGAA